MVGAITPEIIKLDTVNLLREFSLVCSVLQARCHMHDKRKSREASPNRVRAIALAALCLTTSARADRNRLWSLIHDQCVPHQQAGEVPPKPCDQVALTPGENEGVAMFKDREGVAQVLAIPTRKVTGIEDAFLLSPGAPNYFAAAWIDGRARFKSYLKISPPREQVGVTVNSSYNRTQDQLHLHVSCLRSDVTQALVAYAPSLDETWRVMTVELGGRRYWARQARRRRDFRFAIPTSRRRHRRCAQGDGTLDTGGSRSDLCR